MNLRAEISPKLWDAVSAPYESANYSHAILEGMHCLTDLLREKAGVDGDGPQLVGQALGGDTPKIKLNNLLTESEKNHQKGFENIIRGLYQAIRNPRSHGPHSDDKKTADTIIHFLSYIVEQIEQSKTSFDLNAFLQQLLDDDFVQSTKYAELLVQELPPLRRGEAILAIYEIRENIDLAKLSLLIDRLLKSLSPQQAAVYAARVSEDFRSISGDASIRTALRLLNRDIWTSLQELPKHRIENKLLDGIEAGIVMENGRSSQALATWARQFLPVFSLRQRAARVLTARLESKDPAARGYIAKFFFTVLPEVIGNDPLLKQRNIRAIAKAVRAGDANVGGALLGWITSFPNDWQDALAEELKDMTDTENPAAILHDGAPFLSAPENTGTDDIPF